MPNDDFLGQQLIRLGDMMGDGEHLEPGGKWISKEYGKIARALGYVPKRKRPNVTAIDEHMKRRVTEVKCQKCNGQLKQTRGGSKRARCGGCGAKYQLLK